MNEFGGSERGCRAFGYVRSDEAFSRENQEQAILDLCQREGLVLERFFRDEGSIPETPDYLQELVEALGRPGLSRLGAMPLKDDVTIVVCSLNRFTSNPVLQEGILLFLTGSGARVMSCAPDDEDLLHEDPGVTRGVGSLPADPTRRLIRIAVETGADVLPLILIRNQESEDSEPDDDRRLGTPSEQARLIRSLNPRASLRFIGRELEAAGYRRRNGAPWHPEQIRRMLQSA